MSDIFILNESKDKNIKSKSVNNKSFLDKINDSLLSSQSFKIKDKVVFYRLLATMINAGITIIKAVSILEKQEKNPLIKMILLRFSKELKQGTTFSECLGLFPKSFSNAEIGMVESGEKTGGLNKSLLTLADQVEKVASISGKLKSAMMYPIMVTGVVILVVIIMMVFVVPRLLEIFDDKSKLPASTQALMAISNFFSHQWYILIIIGLVVAIVFPIWKKTESGKYQWNSFLLKLPIFGNIITKTVLSKFSRVLSGLLSSGVSIVESLRICSEAVGNEVYRQRILLIREDVKKGLKVGETLEGDDLFSDMFVQMLKVGEQTAQLDKILIKVADFYDEQIDSTVSTINKLLEPIIIVTMALIVGFIAIAIMEPIMGLADQVSNS